jgi:hypothetical protein
MMNRSVSSQCSSSSRVSSFPFLLNLPASNNPKNEGAMARRISQEALIVVCAPVAHFRGLRSQQQAAPQP